MPGPLGLWGVKATVPWFTDREEWLEEGVLTCRAYWNHCCSVLESPFLPPTAGLELDPLLAGS